jgi:hypothetical protein
MLVRVEGAHGGEGGAPGQHTWHTQCPFLINCNSVSCNRNATGAAARVSGTSGRVTEALAARIMSFDNRGLLDLLGPVAVKELE